MNLTYITQTTRINTDFEICVTTNGEHADQHLALCVAPAYQRGTETALTAAYITTNGDPYPFAIENEEGEIFFGRDAFGGDASNYASEFTEWLTPDAIRSWLAFQKSKRGMDDHFLFRLADAIEAARSEV